MVGFVLFLELYQKNQSADGAALPQDLGKWKIGIRNPSYRGQRIYMWDAAQSVDLPNPPPDFCRTW